MNTKHLFSALLIALTLSINVKADTLTLDGTLDSLDIEALMYASFADSIENAMNYETGSVSLAGDIAVLDVPPGYKFLGSEQSKYVLTDLWGNPPDETLGMLFPDDMSPLHDDFSYVVEITYSEEGYIDDEDAEDLDYDEMLEEMQQEARDANEQRVEMGYGTVELLGWASPPYYDSEHKKLHWAKELRFDGAEVNTLNYNIRVLGRKGYLNLNVIGDISVLPMVQADIDKFLENVHFQEGNRYADFNPDLDEVAAYGIGGLITGKLLAKAGFFTLLLKFWKVIAIAVVGAFAAFKKFIFGGGD